MILGKCVLLERTDLQEEGGQLIRVQKGHVLMNHIYDYQLSEVRIHKYVEPQASL
jgi:hypothetical protein